MGSAHAASVSSSLQPAPSLPVERGRAGKSSGNVPLSLGVCPGSQRPHQPTQLWDVHSTLLLYLPPGSPWCRLEGLTCALCRGDVRPEQVRGPGWAPLPRALPELSPSGANRPDESAALAGACVWGSQPAVMACGPDSGRSSLHVPPGWVLRAMSASCPGAGCWPCYSHNWAIRDQETARSFLSIPSPP